MCALCEEENRMSASEVDSAKYWSLLDDDQSKLCCRVNRATTKYTINSCSTAIYEARRLSSFKSILFRLHQKVYLLALQQEDYYLALQHAYLLTLPAIDVFLDVPSNPQGIVNIANASFLMKYHVTGSLKGRYFAAASQALLRLAIERSSISHGKQSAFHHSLIKYYSELKRQIYLQFSEEIAEECGMAQRLIMIDFAEAAYR